MASLIDLSSLTIEPRQAEAINEAVFAELYSKPELQNAHMIMTGIVQDRYIPIFGQFDLMGLVDPGDCSSNTNSSQLPVSQKQWATKTISDRLSHCNKQIDQNFRLWAIGENAMDNWSDVNEALLQFLSERIVSSMADNILRLASFGDTAADTVANGGTLTNGTTKGYFNILNGLWKQIFTDQALGTPKSKRVEIAENNEATWAAQKALASDRAYKVLEEMASEIDSRAFNGQNLVFQMTRTMYNNYKNYLRDKSLTFTLQNTESGFAPISFDGIPILVRNDWDRIISTYYNDGTVLDNPHRVILTDLGNIPLGTSDTTSMSEFKPWYSDADRKYYFDIAYKQDVKLLQEELLAVAY